MEHYYQQFVKTLKNFIRDLNRYVPNEGCKKFLECFNDLDMYKVILRYEGMMREHEDKLKNMDESVFNNKLVVFPGIELQSLWKDIKEEKKKKIFTYLHMLLVISDMMIKSGESESKNANEENFNPYLGVGNSSESLSVSEICSNNLPEDKPTKPGLGSLANMIGVDKMFNIKQLTDQLKNMKKEDIDEATKSLKSLFGNNIDDGTSEVISDMLTNIKDELGKDDISEGNPLDNIVKIAESVAAKMKPKMENGSIDMSKLWSSTQNLTSQFKDQNGQELFGKNGFNPLDVIGKMMGNQNSSNPLNPLNPQGPSSQSPPGPPGPPNMTQEEYMNKCNEMLKNMGMNNINFDDVNKNNKK